MLNGDWFFLGLLLGVAVMGVVMTAVGRAYHVKVVRPMYAALVQAARVLRDAVDGTDPTYPDDTLRVLDACYDAIDEADGRL